MDLPIIHAPGWPGILPRWTSSAKSGVGGSLSPISRVWFTLSHGIINEVYYPDVDQACTRDMELIITNGRDFFSEEKRHSDSSLSYIASGVPAYRIVNNCKGGYYRIEKDILTDPLRDVVLQRTVFTPLKGALKDYHLYVLLAPHLANRGAGNTAWVGDYKGEPMIFARRAGNALALACSAPWLKRSVGFVGHSDGWQDLVRHKIMTWDYTAAENGNVAITAEVDLRSCRGRFVLALGFGRKYTEAANRALGSLQEGFDRAQSECIQSWQDWQQALPVNHETGKDKRNLFRISMGVLRTHEAKRFPGCMIASLSIPWGFNKGDDDLGGYHLVWPRDLVESAGGLLAAGLHTNIHRALHYLHVTQDHDGHWPQNMWLDGAPYWTGIQMDETAFPILLVDLARREGALEGRDLESLWPMVRRAAGFLARNGPVTQQDRWEEDPGYSPFTLAVQIAALLIAADLADTNGESGVAAYLRETADAWNARIECWTYVKGTELARHAGVEGYYVRIAPPEEAAAGSPREGFVPIKFCPIGRGAACAAYIVSPDALALVRFGLRSPLDPRIVNTVKVIDAILKVDMPTGPAWRRYNDDNYGEHQDGAPFDGSGIGRAWPLLTGERAHYELAAGRPEEARRLLETMASFANEGGMIPEQVWDVPDIPSRGLHFGKPTGSAMPLVWAHAEYIKLIHSIHDGRVFDMPAQTVERYLVNQTVSNLVGWRFNGKCRAIPRGLTLRVEVLSAATVRWTLDGWRSSQDADTKDSGLGVHYVDLPTGDLASGARACFTFHWREADRWEGADFEVLID